MVDKQIWESIVCTANVVASLGGTGPHGYIISKTAVVGLVRSAASELGIHGIRVNSVSPFGVATPLTCGTLGMEANEIEEHTTSLANLKGVVLKARHIAEAVLFLASDESDYVSEQNMVVDGGFSICLQGLVRQ